MRSEMNVPAGAKVPLVLVGAGDGTDARVLKRHEETIVRLARLDAMTFARPPPAPSQIVLDETTAALPLAGVIDIGAESKRLEREIDKVGSRSARSTPSSPTRTSSPAPPEVVEEHRERKADAEATAARLEQALKRLEAAL